jgi:hypothetical protein
MKKTFILLLALVMVCSLCACGSAPKVPENATKIGYVIIPHADGDEHADIYAWSTNNGIVNAYCLDGRLIMSPQIIVVLEPQKS